MTLFPPRLQIAVQSKMADMKQAYMEVIRSDLWSGEEIEYSKFLWAWFCVNSRSVFYRSAGSEFVREDGNHLALAPYLDLLNHSVGAKVNRISGKQNIRLTESRVNGISGKQNLR